MQPGSEQLFLWPKPFCSMTAFSSIPTPIPSILPHSRPRTDAEAEVAIASNPIIASGRVCPRIARRVARTDPRVGTKKRYQALAEDAAPNSASVRG